MFFNLSASGGCSLPNINANPPSGSLFLVGTTTVFVTASDTCGTTTNCSFTVTVVQPPIVLNCSTNITVSETGSGGATVSFNLSASGGCSLPNINANPPSGSTFPAGTTTVFVTASDTCGNSTNCSFTVTVNPQADLAVTKGVSTSPSGPYSSSVSVAAGQTVYFQIGIANNGPTTASNVVINDLLPPGLSYYSNSPAGNPFTYNSATGVWTVGTLSPNAGLTSYMYVDAIATNTGSFTNTATVPVPGGVVDPNLNNNTATAVATVTNASQSQADLMVIKGVSTNSAGPYAPSISVAAGTVVYFQIGIANNGPNNASNVVINDLLPPGLGFVTNYSFNNVFPYNPATGVWTIGTVTIGSGTGYMYLTAVATNLGSLTNVATVPVPGGMTDPNLNNNTAKAVVLVYPVYSLSGYARGCQTNGPPIAFTTVNLSGAANATTLTDTNGFFVFSNLPAGTCTVTPVQPGNSFSPASATVALNSNTNLPVFMGQVEPDPRQGCQRLDRCGHPGHLPQPDRRDEPDGNDRCQRTVQLHQHAAGHLYGHRRAHQRLCLHTHQRDRRDRHHQLRGPGQLHFAAAHRVARGHRSEPGDPGLEQQRAAGAKQGNDCAGLPATAQRHQPAGAAARGAPLWNFWRFAAGGFAAVAHEFERRLSGANRQRRRGPQQLYKQPQLPGAESVAERHHQPAIRMHQQRHRHTDQRGARQQHGDGDLCARGHPQVKFFGINWVNSAGAAQNINQTQLTSLRDRMRATYPVASVDAQYASVTLSAASLRGTNSSLGDNSTNSYPSLSKINSSLLLSHFLDSLFVPVGNRIYYGALAGMDYTVNGPPKQPSLGQAIGIPGLTSSGFVPANPYGAAGFMNGLGRQTASHEVGHDLGLQHTVNATFYGYQTYFWNGSNWVARQSFVYTNSATRPDVLRLWPVLRGRVTPIMPIRSTSC